ncbi:MAG: nucleotidyltransferase domain-containing protein [Candidatus Pacearchaeota archaeon]|jgi:predicted nucleotidyltransferase|nr:nucleotidyltransferase domain-containing protein [Candidatus Pacearchaeota archaeon]|tara:strand:- start:61 stop:525 length:465 start_codon:yes stop_codon:yes gene_type:complete
MKNYKIHHCEFNKSKPPKYVYPNQELVLKRFDKFITPYLKVNPFFERVWVWGSLAKGTFGIYKTPYKKQEGSDIDLLVEVNEKFKIPKELRELKEWTKTRTYSRAFYSKINFNNKISSLKSINHKVDFICHFPSKHTKDGFYDKTKISKLIYER